MLGLVITFNAIVKAFLIYLFVLFQYFYILKSPIKKYYSYDLLHFRMLVP